MPAIETVDNDIKERLSVGYLTLLAARAGCQVMVPPLDRVGIDFVVQPVKGTPAQLGVQLKATSNPTFVGNDLAFDLDISTYDQLRRTDLQCPRLLVVLELPAGEADWLVCTAEELVMKRRGYWLNLYGMPTSLNQATQRVHLPVNQILDSDVLSQFFDTMDSNMRAGRPGLL